MFNIGDQIRVKRYDEIPETRKAKTVCGDPHLWNQGKARQGGKFGTIVDKLYSHAYGCNVYRIMIDGYDRASRNVFTDECIEEIRENPLDFRYEITRADDKIRATLYRRDTDGTEAKVASGFGYVFNENMQGIAQAASYALKMIYKNNKWHEDVEGEETFDENEFEEAMKAHEEDLTK